MTIPREFEVIAIRTSGPHDHIERVKFADETDTDAAAAIADIKLGIFYFMRRPGNVILPLRVQQCPDCLVEVLWA